MDGFGRTTKTEAGDAGGTKSTVDTVYDSCGCNPMGKMVKTSIPYAPNGAVYWKQNTYDGLGRTVSATEADGTSTTTYAYLGNGVQVTDPAGKWKKFTSDAFGNLTSVLEPDPLNQPSGTLTTTYAYDILNHLATVTMPRATGTQTRTFNYTTGTTVGTLLLSATNPENGTVTYTYNTDKTLATKTDALNQQFSYAYDSYKRVTQINLGQTVIRQFYYDTNPIDGTFSQNIAGRLAAVQNAPTTNGDTFIEMYSYTQPGQMTKKRLRLSRSVQSHTITGDLDAQYSYDNEGKLTSVTYPQSSYIDPNTLQVLQSPVTTYSYGFDTMSRPTSMTGPGVDGWGNPATVNIVNNVQYGSSSELLQMTYFGSTETRQYNNRLQMTHLTVPGQLNISYNFAAQNNGQISSQTDNLTGEQITYQYDALKRLCSASTSAWSQTFTYDGFGNLTDKVGMGGAPTNHSPVNAATNQLTGYSYDSNGNLATTGYGWDPENRMSYATFGGTQYAYDGMNKRTWAGNYSCPGGFCGPGYGWQFQSETVFFFGIEGKQLASYTPQVKYSYGTPQSIYYLLSEERVYFGNKYIGNANTSLISGGNAVGQDRAGSVGKYFPYGEERNNPQLPNDIVKFASYTRDAPTGLDYADQRYYISGVGRFIAPDPYSPSAGPADPQSWNRYSYVKGDPVGYHDPQGLGAITLEFDPGPSGFTGRPDPMWQWYASGAQLSCHETSNGPYVCDELLLPIYPPIKPPTPPDDPDSSPDCDVQLKDGQGFGGTFTHSYLYVNNGEGWWVLEGTGDPIPITGSHLNAHKSETGTLNLDHPQTDKVQFDAKDVGLSPEQLCNDAQALIDAEKFYEDNLNGKIRYDPLGVFAPNSNSFARYLLTFTPDIYKLVKPAKNARGWRHKIRGR